MVFNFPFLLLSETHS